jgi:putative membrane protein
LTLKFVFFKKKEQKCTKSETKTKFVLISNKPILFKVFKEIIMGLLLFVPLETGVIGSIVYGFIGMAMAILAAKVVDWITPGNLFKQLTDEKNIPLAIFTGLLVLGICIIIAASIAG